MLIFIISLTRFRIGLPKRHTSLGVSIKAFPERFNWGGLGVWTWYNLESPLEESLNEGLSIPGWQVNMSLADCLDYNNCHGKTQPTMVALFPPWPWVLDCECRKWAEQWACAHSPSLARAVNVMWLAIWNSSTPTPLFWRAITGIGAKANPFSPRWIFCQGILYSSSNNRRNRFLWMRAAASHGLGPQDEWKAKSKPSTGVHQR